MVARPDRLTAGGASESAGATPLLVLAVACAGSTRLVAEPVVVPAVELSLVALSISRGKTNWEQGLNSLTINAQNNART